MGAGRRNGFVRSSDEEDECSGAPMGVDSAGPSSSCMAQKRRRHSISQSGRGQHSTTGKTKSYRRLKHTAESKITDLDSDSDEDYEYEDIDIVEAALRQRKSGWKENTGASKKNGKKRAKLSPRKKRKQSLFSSQKNYASKAGGIQFEETEEELTEQWDADAGQRPLGKEFEQYLLEEVFDISKDTYTKEVDLPERFQIHEQFVSAYIAKGDWSKEAYWIYDKAFGNSAIISEKEELKAIADIDKEEIVQEIIFVLMQLHVQKCEIPFIGLYNFHGCMHLAGRNGSSEASFNFEENNMQLKSFEALWWIFHWDQKWLLLQHHVDKQQEMWKKRSVIKESDRVAKDGMLDMLIQALQDAESEQVVDDLLAKFNLLFPTDEEAPSKGQYKRPKRQSYYDTCCKSGLRELVKQLGLTPEQLGENLQAMQKIHETLDCDVPPQGASLSCASGQFTEVHHALAGARHMAAHEISCEPRIRNYVRSLFLEHAVLSTRPTAKGKSSIDAFHEFACVKHIQEKSVKKFDDGEWLIIQRAEEEQLVEVIIELTHKVYDGVFMQRLQELYFSNGSNQVAVLWNEQRKLILQEAVSKMMLPVLIKEMRMSLTAKAKAWVQSQCIKNLWKRASVAPYLAAETSPDDYLSSKVTKDAANARVLACCWGPRNPPTTFVMLDVFGELVDTLQTGYLNMYSGSFDHQLQRKTDDQERLQNFIVKHQPHVVVVGATVHYACRQLKDIITETMTRAAELNTSLSSVPVVFGDESLPSLYEKSQVSNVQLPKQPDIIRRAVALGRNLQNPLALLASLCNPSKDIVALNLHPMQRFLSTDELYSAIEQVMITVTNQVGVDVNLAVAHEWLFSPLQFICGFGWKKASMLQQLIQGIRWLPSRSHLLRHPFSLKDVVFRNCSGFLRIRRVAHAISGLRKLDPLDDTRIHPDSYELARKLANYALSKGPGLSDSEADRDMAEIAIVYIQQHPDTLTEASVVDFSNSLQDLVHVNLETLKDIRSELLCGFRDCRAPYTQPTQDEEFTWLTGEDDFSLATGKAVNVTVRKVFRHRIMCFLESGIRGVLEKENFMSDSSVDFTRIFSEGSSLTCCIASVIKDQFLVNLTCIEEEVHTPDASSVQEIISSDKAPEKLGPKDYPFKPRDVSHSHFDNISVSEAIKALSDKNPGEVVFHPSSRGPACLSMTLKCHNNVYLQKEIEELDKDSTNLATFLKLGRILKIGGRSFQNLDEVVTSYAPPLMLKMNEVLQLKEFRSGCDSEIKSFLHQEKGVSSESLVYCFSMCPNNPGAIAVSYVMDGNIRQETVDLYPEGYGFQSKMFRKIDTLVNYLKKAVLAASYEPQMQGGQGEDNGGTGRGRGRGGRFGFGRRGRGRDGRGGRGNGSTGTWEDDSKDGTYSFGDAHEDAQEGGTFLGGWGDKDGWSQSQNNNRSNRGGCGERGSFRGRRCRGRGYGRGEGSQWGQAKNKTEDDFWTGGTSRKEDTDPLKVPDTGAGNDSWAAGNAANDGWGQGKNKTEENFWSGGTNRKEDTHPLKTSDTGAGNESWDAGNAANDGWGSMGCHMAEHNKTSEKNLSSWNADCNMKSSSEEKANEWVQNGNAEKHLQDDKLNGLEGWGMATELPGTVSKDKEDAKDSHNGWDSVDIQTSANAGNAGSGGWGTGNDGWESAGRHMEEHNKRNEKDLSSWSVEYNSKSSSEEKGNGWGQDGNAGQHDQDKKANGSEGWGLATETLGTAAKHVENAKDSLNGWDTVEKANPQTSTSAENAGDIGWGSGNDGRGSTVSHMDELKKNEKNLSDRGAGCKSSEGKGNGWAQDGNRIGGGLLSEGPTVGGWGDDDSQEKKRTIHMGWGAQKGHISSGGLLGKAPTAGGWGGSSEGGREESSVGGWGDDDSQKKQRNGDMGWGAQKGEDNGGGLLGKAPTVQGWGESSQGGGRDDDSQDKDRSGGVGWGTQKEQRNGGWGDGDSQEKDRSGGLGWETQKEHCNGGWGGSHGSEEKWPKDDNQQQTQNYAEGYNPRGSFRGGQGQSRGMGRGFRGRWSQGEGGRGRGGRGRWSQGEEGMGRGGRGRWSRGEEGMGRGNRGGWSQSEGDIGGARGSWPQGRGDGAGRRGRGGRGRWNDADGMGRGGRGSWAHKQGECANDNSWSNDGWNGVSKAAKADANDWWALGGNEDTAQKERGPGKSWGPKENSKDEAGTGWDGWASSSCEVEPVGWGDAPNKSGETTKETPAQTGWGTWTQSSKRVNNGSSKVNVTSEKSSDWGADDSGWKSSKDTGCAHDHLNVDKRADAHNERDVSHNSGLQNDPRSEAETVGWGDTLNKSEETTKETSAQNRMDGGESGWGTWTQSSERVDNGSSKDDVTSKKSSDWGADDSGWKSSKDTGCAHDRLNVDKGWDAHYKRDVSHSSRFQNDARSEVETVGWGDALNNSGKATKETPAQNCMDGGERDWGTWTQRSECVDKCNSKVDVTSEKSSDWGADDNGWKSSKDTGSAHDGLNVDKGWDALNKRDVSYSSGLQSDVRSAKKECIDLKQTQTESRERAEFLTQQIAPMKFKLAEKEFGSKEGTEERGDSIWGACEDLIDSREMEGLISPKGPDNALEPQIMNDGQGQEAVSKGLGHAAIAD